jgi:benzoyl-CoA reductase/2-hydroxyglutaryl-CoA dehydratase subunit BcrC/BadD/HgdB
MAAVSGSHMENLNASKTVGFTQDACSVNRLTAGYFLNGKWPKPDFFIGSYNACDGIAKNTDLLRTFYPDMPYFHFEQPYKESKEGVDYLVSQLKEMIAFLEEQTRRKIDWDKLGEHLGYALRMSELHRKISELRKRKPTPLRSRKVPELELADFYFCGEKIGTDFYETVHEEALQRIANGIGGIENERFRLTSPYVYPTYVWGMVDWLEKEWGAVHVTELFFSGWGPQELDPAKPLECMAKKMYAHPIVGTQGGSLVDLISRFVKDVEDYKVDALLWWAHRGCPHGCGSIYSTSKAMRERFNLPVLELDSDYVDPNFEPKERMQERLNAFFEMLASRKK